jgi:asparagine synthase (glutamine-hydrolysing)
VAKTRHEFIELGQGYIEDFENMAGEMIRLSDGMYHPHESTEMLALDYFGRAPFKVLLRGHGGEIAKAALAYPVMVSPNVYECSSRSEIIDCIFNIANLVIRDIEIDKLFTPAFQDIMKAAPGKSLAESCGAASDRLAPADVCIYYYINEHIRRQVVASLEIFRTRIEVRLPYIDEAYIGSLLKLPVKYRNEGEIHFELIKRCMPSLLRIPNSNTGARLDAGPVRLFIMDKFNSVMKRLSITGYRHYTEYQKWHREGFKKSSEKIIFSDQTAARNIYNMDNLKSVFDLHISGRKDYGHLLGTIVGLELWFRKFVEK